MRRFYQYVIIILLFLVCAFSQGFSCQDYGLTKSGSSGEDPIPNPPINLTAERVSETQINLSWTNDSKVADGFKIERRTGAGGTYLQIDTVNVNVHSYSDTGLIYGTTYYYRVRAYNANGYSAYATDSAILSNTYTYTGGRQIWIVPDGVTSIQVDVIGASGGGGGWGSGGYGARVQTTLSVTPGETLYIYVGGRGLWNSYAGEGWGGYNGGGGGKTVGFYGGGGGSDIRQGGTALDNRVVVAGGGGGCGAGEDGGSGGYNGGSGGTEGGGGGTQNDGGTGGDGSYPGSAGRLGSGGAGNYHGSGGGGGYYGGGGGGASNDNRSGGGGGGSSYSSGTSTTYTDGYQSGNGQIIISH